MVEVEMDAPPVVRAKCLVGPDQYLEYDLYYCTSDAHLAHAAAWVATQKAIGLDLETDGSSPDGLNHRSKKIATMQIGTPRGPDPRVYVICMRSVSEDALRPIFDVLESRQVVKLGQNIAFELKWLQTKYGLRIKNVACCQLAELVLRAGLFPAAKVRGEDGAPDRKAYSDTSMKKLCQRYLDITIEKGEDVRLKFWVTPPGTLSRRQLEYAAGDVIYPFYLAAAQREEIQDRGLREIIKIEFELLPTIVDSELWGVGLHKQQWMQLYQEATQHRMDAKKRLDDLVQHASVQSELFLTTVYELEAPGKDGWRKVRKEEVTRPNLGGKREINWDAPAQAQTAIKSYCKEIGWPVEIITKWDRLLQVKKLEGASWLERHPGKTAEDVPDYCIPEDRYFVMLKVESDVLRLGKIRRQLPAEIVDAYLTYKEYAKAAGTYGINFINKHLGEDGRIHSNWHQAITSTGRMSSEPNLQNLPRNPAYRKCFIPAPGNRFIIADYSQIEPRLSAQVSQDVVYLATFTDGADIYVRSGEAMTGMTIDKATEEGAMMRQIFKAVALALAYNMGPGKLRNALTLALEDYILSGKHDLPSFEWAQGLHKRFFEAHEGIKHYQTRCITDAAPILKNEQGEIDNPRKIYDRYLDQGVTYITGPCGRKRFFPADAKAVYTEAPNAPIQGSSATITKLAACLIMQECERQGIEGVHVVLYVHDELVVECPAAVAYQVRDIVKEQMEAAARRYITRVPVKAEFPKGTDGVVNWWLKEAV